MNDLQIINQIGLFSKKNTNFLNYLKKNNIDFENQKKTKSSTITINDCKVIFDYDDLQIKTKGNCENYTKFLS